MKTPIRSFTFALSLAIHSPSLAADKTASTVQANTEFGLELYSQLANENAGKNLFFSPYSVSNALAMTAEGAHGKTALEMGSVLGLTEGARNGDSENRPWDMTELHAGIGALNKRFNRASKPYALSIANAIWGEKSYSFNEAYIDTLNSSYGTEALRLVNFIGDFEAERERINLWAESRTEKRIKDLLPKGSLDSDTRMVLANAIYFKGDWASQFDAKRTVDGDFAIGGGKSIKTKLMNAHSMSGARYAAFNADGSSFDTPAMLDRRKKMATYPGADGFAMAELPYKGKELSMVIIAPNSADGLAAIEGELKPKVLTTWLGKLQDRKLHVTLPKFKSEITYKLNGTLAAMGMPTAFRGKANFNGMRAGESDAGLYISLVVHKAFVEVNEEGTEAAAATGVVMTRKSAKISKPFIPHFKADRPFIYLIRDTKSGSILFMGRMMNPES